VLIGARPAALCWIWGFRAFGLAQMMLEEPDVRGAIFCLFG